MTTPEAGRRAAERALDGWTRLQEKRCDEGEWVQLLELIATAIAQAVQEERDSLSEALAACLIAQPMSNGQYVHHVVCSGDRREPAGKPGHSCSCAIAPRSLLHQAEQRVRTLAGVLTELVALSPGCGYCDSFDVITNVLDKARAALTPPEGSTLCGVKGCTLPSTHGDEPHSWEPPTGGPPAEGSAAEGK